MRHHNATLPLAAVTLATALTAGCATAAPVPSRELIVAEVNRLCDQDGGMHIYEVVPQGYPYRLSEARKLPGGQESIYLWSDRAHQYSIATTQLPGSSNEVIQKHQSRMQRIADGKLMGEFVSYSASHGVSGTPGYWSHTCAAFKNGGPGDNVFSRAIQGIGEIEWTIKEDAAQPSPIAPVQGNRAEVSRLCQQDGGMRIYEVVPGGRGCENPKKGVYRRTIEKSQIPGPGHGIQRTHDQFWRIADGKLMGEYVNYSTDKRDLNQNQRMEYSCFAGENPGFVFQRALCGIKDSLK